MTKIEIEEKICEIQKEVTDLQRNLRENEREFKKLNEKIEIATTSYNFNKNNKKHIKNQAEVVGLKEYKNIIEKITEMGDLLNECNNESSKLTKARIQTTKLIDSKNLILDTLRQELSTFGQIIELKVN